MLTLVEDFRNCLPFRFCSISLGAPVANSTESGSTWKRSPGFNRYPGYGIFFPLTLTLPCVTNCLACFALLANNALKMAISNRFSIGAYVMCMYGIFFLPNRSLVGSTGCSSPDPLPAASSDPSFSAKYLGSMGTTALSFGVNILCHCFSLISSGHGLRFPFLLIEGEKRSIDGFQACEVVEVVFVPRCTEFHLLQTMKTFSPHVERMDSM